MSTNQKGKKRQVWMSLGLAGVLVTNCFLPYAVPANEVQAVETTQTERETKVTTIPAGSTFASIFPSSKLALQVAMEIYPQTHPNNIDVKKEVTQAELDRVTTIEDDPDLGDPIGNIEGVQYLRNLENLWVGTTSGFSGYIENLDVLSNLTKLKVLAVKNQAISDISGIKNLTNLTYLNLADNKITDASPIAGLTKLEHIDFSRENRIQSLAPFRQLTHLKKLFLSSTLSDFRPLQHLPLIQDPNATWALVGNITLPDAYVGEPVFMQAFDPTGEQVLFGGVMVDGKWEGTKAYDGKYATYSKVGMGNVTFTQSLSEPSGTDRYIRVDFKQRVLPAKATVQPITVRYVDDQGEVLAPEERLTGVLGEAYEAKAKTIDGYQLTEEPVNRIGTFGTEAQTVTFVYTKETKATTIPAGSTFASVFPDYKLALQVAMEIYPQTRPDKIDVKKEVTQAELDRVTIIEDDPALGDPIGNIEGVQYLRNLEDLWVGIAGDFRGKVENLDVLSNLTKLKVLAVKNQALSDISGIKNLTNLTLLNLTDNKITDAGPIAGLTKLEFISLDMGNNIQSLAPFRQLTNLKKLYLNASVSDFRPLQHLPLIQDASNTWELRGEVQLPDAYVGEPVFMQAFDPTGQQVAYGSVYLDDKWQGLDAYQNNHVIWTKQGTVGSVTFTQRPVGATDYSRYIRVDFKQRVLPAKATVQPVTVRYVDDQGEVLALEERLTGVLGEAYEAQAKTIDSYQLTKEPANRVGTFSTEAQTVTFVYIKEAVPASQAVTVRHLDTEGRMIAPDEVLTGAVGDTYEAQAKVVLGYRLVTTPANQTGTFGTEAQTVTFVYAQETAPSMAQPVTVQYVDDQGQALTQEETLTGALGAPYQAEAKTIPGYQLTSLPSDHTGTFQAVAQTVRFVYTKQALPVAQPVTVQHVDAQGKAVAEEDILLGYTGETYHAKAKVISGYHVSEHPANATGLFGPSAQTVRFVYAPDESIEAINPVEEEPTTPPKPSLPSPVTEDTRTPALPLPTEVSSETSPSVVPVVPGPALPSLGERTTHAIGWGLALLVVGTWLFLRPRYPSSKRKRS
ncbi:MucBP domain-containing protein [Listeria booriae]|uniref:MucBP domain-containing protein n=1 Tax=Listeria booriae TaxID=1552123 RepID=UPI00162AA368|nr:MucBP domain-containing protein [Listeria booriae]MBC2174549.1 hypothetical protein [Listeria booriae]